MRKQVHRIRQLRDRTDHADKLVIIVTDWRREGRQTRSRFDRQQNAWDVAALAADERLGRNAPQPACRLVIGNAIREPNYAVAVDVCRRLRSAMLRYFGPVRRCESLNRTHNCRQLQSHHDEGAVS